MLVYQRVSSQLLGKHQIATRTTLRTALTIFNEQTRTAAAHASAALSHPAMSGLLTTPNLHQQVEPQKLTIHMGFWCFLKPMVESLNFLIIRFAKLHSNIITQRRRSSGPCARGRLGPWTCWKHRSTQETPWVKVFSNAPAIPLISSFKKCFRFQTPQPSHSSQKILETHINSLPEFAHRRTFLELSLWLRSTSWAPWSAARGYLVRSWAKRICMNIVVYIHTYTYIQTQIHTYMTISRKVIA